MTKGELGEPARWIYRRASAALPFWLLPLQVLCKLVDSGGFELVDPKRMMIDPWWMLVQPGGLLFELLGSAGLCLWRLSGLFVMAVETF